MQQYFYVPYLPIYVVSTPSLKINLKSSLDIKFKFCGLLTINENSFKGIASKFEFH